MRTSEERIEELHRRIDQRKREHNLRDFRIRSAAGIAVCLALALFGAFAVAAAPVGAEITAPEGIAGSIFTDNGALGYVVVALLAFFLGAAVTVFCYRQRKRMEEKNGDRKL